MTLHEKEILASWIFAGAWLVLLVIGVLVSWRTARQPNRAYRAFVPLIGLVTVFLLAGTLTVAATYFPR